jgi:SAM-dependent methyltransferase
MIERIDLDARNRNPVFNRFCNEHLCRYELAASFIKEKLSGLKYSPVIIDAACGCGYGSPILARVGHYVGLDYSLMTIHQCQADYKEQFQVADLDTECFLALKPDAIVSLETAEHLRDPRQFFQQIHAALPDGAPFVFSAPTSLTMDFDPFHKRDWSQSRWADTLERAGFAIRRTVPMPFSAKFSDFLGTIPTTLRQKCSVGWFGLTHWAYARLRFKTWILKNRFDWESTLWCCEAMP